jgi:hypothetical protein
MLCLPHSRGMAQRHPAHPDITPRALAEADSARYVGLSRAYLKAARHGRCDGPPYVRAGRAVRYLIADLDRWLEARRVGGGR